MSIYELPRECNDLGDHGVCTHCGKLHTVTIVPPDLCEWCGALCHPGDALCAHCTDFILATEKLEDLGPR